MKATLKYDGRTLFVDPACLLAIVKAGREGVDRDTREHVCILLREARPSPKPQRPSWAKEKVNVFNASDICEKPQI